MNVLVIKLGALGDFVQTFAAFAAIRAHHRADRVTLLTTAPFAGLGERAPWFDRVLVDTRPGWWRIPAVLHLRRMLQDFDFVFDLQTSGRSNRYFRLAGRPLWSGIARGASHPHANPARNAMHNAARQREQLRDAGVMATPVPELGWLTAGGPVLPTPYALLAPGCSPHLPWKRWPAVRYGALASLLARRGIRPVVVGTASERSLAAEIAAACADTLDLSGQTSLFDLGGLAARACLTVGNDTGPTHLAAAVGCRTVALFSSASRPDLAAPHGPVPGRVAVLCETELADLPIDRVAACLPERHECCNRSESS